MDDKKRFFEINQTNKNIDEEKYKLRGIFWYSK